MGSYLVTQQKYREAITIYLLLSNFDKKQSEYFQILNYLHYMAFGSDAAHTFALKWVAKYPDDFHANFHAFESCLSQRDLKGAGKCLDAAKHSRSQSPVVDHMQGLWFRHTNRLSESIESFRSAIKKHPHYCEAMLGLSESLLDNKEQQSAIKLLEEIVRLRPDYVNAYYELSRLNYYKEEKHPHIEIMQSYIKNQSLQTAGLARLHFTLGEIYDRIKNYDEAFAQYQLGNNLRRRHFNCESLKSYTSALIECFSSDWLNNTPINFDSLQDEKHYIFIVGMPRSGSTLVEQILASHPDVDAGGEYGLVKQTIRLVEELYGARPVYPRCVRSLDLDVIKNLRLILRERVDLQYYKKSHFSDKSLSQYMDIGLISRLFPGSKVVHCMRQPKDTMVSCYFQDFHDLRWSNSLGEIKQVQQEYERLMTHWSNMKQLSIHHIKYEDIINNAPLAINRLLEFCGLEWSPGCLEFYRTRRPVMTASLSQVNAPIYSTSVQRWKNYEKYL